MYIGIMEKIMEPTIQGLGFRVRQVRWNLQSWHMKAGPSTPLSFATNIVLHKAEGRRIGCAIVPSLPCLKR